MPGDAPELPDHRRRRARTRTRTPTRAPPRRARSRAAPSVIKAFWKHAPLGPGVYRMLGESGEVLYVGKARSIKKRILSYTAPQRLSHRIARMVAADRVDGVRHGRDRSGIAAARSQSDQAVEAALQRAAARRQELSLHPRHRRPRGAAHRQAPRRARRQGRLLRPLRQRRRRPRARCRRCSARSCCAPAPTAITPTAPGPACCTRSSAARRPAPARSRSTIMRGLVGEARDFLSGRSRAVRHRLAREMGEAAEALEFERAARLRDRISALSAIQGEQSVNPRSVPEADVFAIAEEAGQFCIEAFFFRTYQNWGNRAYFPRADRTLERRGGARRVPRAILPRAPRPAPGAAEPRSPDAKRRWARSCRSAPAGASPSARPSAARRRSWSTTPPATRARRCRANFRRPRRSRSCWPRSARRSASTIRRAASRSTTIPTSWGPTRSARWSSPGRKAS